MRTDTQRGEWTDGRTDRQTQRQTDTDRHTDLKEPTVVFAILRRRLRSIKRKY